jgi:hypothetical protein
MAKEPSPRLTRVKYHRISMDARGGTRFDTVTVKQSLAQAAPPAASFYVTGDRPATRYRLNTFPPGWIGELHPAPTRQFLSLMSGAVEMEATDGTVRSLGPGDLILPGNLGQGPRYEERGGRVRHVPRGPRPPGLRSKRMEFNPVRSGRT